MSDTELYEWVVDALDGASEAQLVQACAVADEMNRELGIQRRISAQRRLARMAGRTAAPFTRAMSCFRKRYLSAYEGRYGERPWRWVDDAFSGVVAVDRSLLLAPLVEAGILVEEDLVEAGILAEEDLA